MRKRLEREQSRLSRGYESCQTIQISQRNGALRYRGCICFRDAFRDEIVDQERKKDAVSIQGSLCAEG